ncbi:MAG: hypothetical protein QM664_14860, partial [Flavihumibacter sp.]
MPRLVTFACMLLLLFTCRQPDKSSGNQPAADSLTEQQKHLPENALRGLNIADGLEVTPFAAEPMLQNPTNLDVDDRGILVRRLVDQAD